MKVLEAQSAILSNYEVYQHLAEQQDRYKHEKRRPPPNMATVVRELLQYLRTHPSPLSQEPITYTPECIAALLQRLKPYELSKGEVIMILNLRPASVAALNTVVEDMSERLTEDQQAEIVDIVAEVLGQFDAPPEEGDEATANGGDGDVSMENAATGA